MCKKIYGICIKKFIFIIFLTVSVKCRNVVFCVSTIVDTLFISFDIVHVERYCLFDCLILLKEPTPDSVTAVWIN